MEISSYQPAAITRALSPAQTVTPDLASRFDIEDTIEISTESLRTQEDDGGILPPINDFEDV